MGAREELGGYLIIGKKGGELDGSGLGGIGLWLVGGITSLSM